MAQSDEIYWMPQPGPQTEAFTCPADEIFFGGSRGGGKSDGAIGRQITGALKYGVKWNGLMVRKKYKDFKEIRRRIDELIVLYGLPAKRIGGDQQLNVIRFQNGALITLAALGSVEAADDWVGHQFTEISIEEAPQLPYIAPLMDKLKGSLRSPHGVPAQMFMTGNPGGPGASQIKAMFIPIENGGDLEDVKEGRVNWVDVEQDDGSVARISRVFIRSDLRDNKILCDNDPKYVNRLLSIQDPARRAAWIEGRWDVFIGQAFDFSRKNLIELPIWPIPEFAPVFMTFDWGFGAPFSVIWSWVDGDGRIYAAREWYGSRKNMPNTGLRLTDTQIIEGILEREEQFGLIDRHVTWLLGPDCFRKKANYMGGGQGPATSDEWKAYLKREDVVAKYGDLTQKRPMVPGDANKETKIRQFRNRLAVSRPGEMPMLMVYPECRSLIRTVPTLCVDEINVEVLEDGQEDHCLIGDTLVDTDKGQIPIRDLVGTSGKVLTAGGFWTDYSDCRLTVQQADVVKVTFEDGRTVVCTPTHRFLVANEHQTWIDAKDLTDVTCRINLSKIDYIKETEIGVCGNFRTITNKDFALPVERSSSAADKLVRRLARLSYPTTLKAIKVESAGKADVYCLTATHTHAFSIENGIVVHNSYDSICHVCQYHPIGMLESDVEFAKKSRKTEAQRKKLDTASRAALEEWEKTIEELADTEEAPAWMA